MSGGLYVKAVGATCTALIGFRALAAVVLVVRLATIDGS